MYHIYTHDPNLNVVIVNGYMGSGKTTFEKACIRMLGSYFCRSYSSVAFVKDIARQCGWNGDKNERNRNFLSALKDLLTEWADVPYQKCLREIAKVKNEVEQLGDPAGKAFLFIDVREPAEIARFKKLGASALLVRRPTVGKPTGALSHADTNIGPDSLYDTIIENDGTLDDLQKKAYNYIKETIEKKGGELYGDDYRWS